MSGLYTYSGKHVVVTGGASGVGAALVTLLDSLGAAEIVVLDVREPDGLTASHRWIPTDLGNQGALAKSVAQLGRVDVLFNNAAVAGTAPLDTVLAVNVLAPRYLIQAVGDAMTAGGTIVNTASTAGGQWGKRVDAISEVLDIADWEDALAWFGQHHDSLGIDPYSFSKECLHVLTQRLAVPLGRRGLRINSVCPSPVDTPLLREFRVSWGDKVIDFTAGASGGLVSAAEVAQVLAFLGMDASARINGVNLLVDGGSTAGFLTGSIDTSALRS